MNIPPFSPLEQTIERMVLFVVVSIISLVITILGLHLYQQKQIDELSILLKEHTTYKPE